MNESIPMELDLAQGVPNVTINPVVSGLTQIVGQITLESKHFKINSQIINTLYC